MWLSLVERCVRDAEAAGSNPVISTTEKETSFATCLFFLNSVPRRLKNAVAIGGMHFMKCRYRRPIDKHFAVLCACRNKI